MYQGAIDLATTKRHTKYRELKESYIIFICKNDPFGAEIPVYTKKTIFQETEAPQYNDKTHVVFYNSSAYKKSNNKDISAVLQFIYNLNADTDFTKELAESVTDAKAKPAWEDEYMFFSDILEEEKERVRIEGLAEGKAQGLAESKEEIILKMLEDNLPDENIKQYTGVTTEELEKIKEKLACTVTK